MAAKFLSREDILKASVLRSEAVEVPEWKGSIRVQELDGYSRDVLDTLTYKDQRANLPDTEFSSNWRVRVVALSVVDAEGHRMFSLEDAEILKAMPDTVLRKLYAVARKLSGLGAELEEQAKEGFLAIQNGGLSSG